MLARLPIRAQKHCNRCKTIKDRSTFNQDRSAGDGLQTYCRACQAKTSAEWGQRTKRERNAYTRKWCKANPEKRFNNYLRHSYGINLRQYESLLSQQGGTCAICRLPETHVKRGKVQRMSVDHCHDTGVIRGLLCSRCNNGIGHFEDDADRLRAAVNYLEKNMARAMLVA